MKLLIEYILEGFVLERSLSDQAYDVQCTDTYTDKHYYYGQKRVIHFLTCKTDTKDTPNN